MPYLVPLRRFLADYDFDVHCLINAYRANEVLVRKRGLIRVAVVVDFATEVGPEFFGQVADGVEKDVGAPDGHGVAEGALIFGMVGIGDTGGYGVADDFGVVELEFAAVGAGNEDATYGIFRAMPGGAGAELEVARVLMEERGEDGSGHEGADAGVGEGCGVAFAVTLETLAVGRLTVVGLAHQGDYAEERDGDGIGHGLCCELELGFGGELAEVVVLFDGGVVGEDVEEAIVF